MAFNAGSFGMGITICPACGYPSGGLCAACSSISPAVPVESTMYTSDSAPHFNPAA